MSIGATGMSKISTDTISPALGKYCVRYPLRLQLLLPLWAILLASLAGVSLANVWLVSRQVRQSIDERMQNVAQTLAEGTYPLETNVLRQVRGLSGAELVVRDGERVVASTSPSFNARHHQAQASRTVAGATYFASVAMLDRRASGGGQYTLEIYYPEQMYFDARWRAIAPSLIVGGIALVLAIALASVVAARVTQPVRRLQTQVERIAHGDFTPLPAPTRDDELRELAQAVNRMAELLQANAEVIRRHERDATLHQLGAGIAHQLRNAATGCRMALGLFRREQVASQSDENLLIASRQLELMEHYLQRFLTLGRTTQLTMKTYDACHILRQALQLVRPLAEHLHVHIDARLPEEVIQVYGNDTSLEQVLVNLITNAIEACALPGVDAPQVRVTLTTTPTSIRWQVADNGPGFAEAVVSRIGEAFVTSKPEGTGLGLAVAKEILAQHQGTLAWRREDGWTCFEATLES